MKIPPGVPNDSFTFRFAASVTLGRRLRRAVSILLPLLMLISILAPSAVAFAEDAPPPPTIESDKPDYVPGETVILSGSYWQPGENVHIRVNDDQGETWRRDVDVVATDAGTISDTFQLPDWFVATYTVTATGSISGTATATFTDGNVKAFAAPAGVSFDLTKTVYSSSTTCSGSGTTTTVTGVNATSGETTGVGNTQSVKLEAAATSNHGGAFVNWTNEDGNSDGTGTDPFTIISSRVICVQGFTGGGSHD